MKILIASDKRGLHFLYNLSELLEVAIIVLIAVTRSKSSKKYKLKFIGENVEHDTDLNVIKRISKTV